MARDQGPQARRRDGVVTELKAAGADDTYLTMREAGRRMADTALKALAPQKDD